MYVNRASRIDRSASLDFAAARGFGLVIACDDGHPVASPPPFWLDQADGSVRLEFHATRMMAARMVALRPRLAYD